VIITTFVAIPQSVGSRKAAQLCITPVAPSHRSRRARSSLSPIEILGSQPIGLIRVMRHRGQWQETCRSRRQVGIRGSDASNNPDRPAGSARTEPDPK
jgi:hypothetical protein